MSKFTKFRWKIFNFIRKQYKIKDQSVKPPKSLIFIYYLIFPIQWLISKYSIVNYDCVKNTYEIEGIKMSKEFIDFLKEEKSKQYYFEIMKSKDGYIDLLSYQKNYYKITNINQQNNN